MIFDISTMMRRLLIFVLAILALALNGVAEEPKSGPRDGPFGLERGMKIEDVIAIVGKGAIIKIDQDLVVFSRVPKPHPSFVRYSLSFSPKNGLLKIVAQTDLIHTNGFGEDIQELFEKIRDAIGANYGTPKIYDFLRAGSIWTEPREWMTGLLRKERILGAAWSPPLPNGLDSILLEADAISSDAGGLLLSYEFDGWEVYLKSKRAKQNSVF